MAWIYLIIAGIFEVGWPLSMRYSSGFTRLWPSVLTVACMCSSFGLFSLAIKTLPMGTAYAVWTGIGAVGTVVVGILFLQEARDVARLFCILLILIGIVGLKLTSKTVS